MFVGCGILTLPTSFYKVGIIPGIIGICSAGYLTFYCLDLFLQVVKDVGENEALSLQKLVEKVFGNKGRISVQICILIMQIGVGIAIVLFARSFMDKLFCDLELQSLCIEYPGNYLNNKLSLAVFFGVMIVPLTFINNMHYFYYPSIMATFMVLLNVVLLIVYSIDKISDFPDFPDGFGLASKIAKYDLVEIPKFFGLATYAFEGIGVLFTVRSSMQQPSSFPTVLKTNLTFISVIYSVFPAITCIAFGASLLDFDIVLLQLPSGNHFYLTAQILYAVSALLGYPSQLFPVFNIIEKSLGINREANIPNGNKLNDQIKIYTLRILTSILTIILALMAPSFHQILSLFGSGIFTYLGYLLPIWVFQTYFKGKISQRKQIFNFVVFVVTGVLGICGLCFTIYDMVNGETSNEPDAIEAIQVFNY